jgi:hypothetical protein
LWPNLFDVALANSFAHRLLALIEVAAGRLDPAQLNDSRQYEPAHVEAGWTVSSQEHGFPPLESHAQRRVTRDLLTTIF